MAGLQSCLREALLPSHDSVAPRHCAILQAFVRVFVHRRDGLEEVHRQHADRRFRQRAVHRAGPTGRQQRAGEPGFHGGFRAAAGRRAGACSDEPSTVQGPDPADHPAQPGRRVDADDLRHQLVSGRRGDVLPLCVVPQPPSRALAAGCGASCGACGLKQCKRAKTIADFRRRLGVPSCRAWATALSGKGWCRLSGARNVQEALTAGWFDRLRLVNLERQYGALQHREKPPGTVRTPGGVGGREP